MKFGPFVWILDLGTPSELIPHPVLSDMKHRHTVETLTPVVMGCTNYWQVVEKLELQPGGASSHRIKEVIRDLGISTSHFVRSTRGGRGHKVPLEERLVLNRRPGRRETSDRLYLAVLAAGVPEQCHACGMGPVWQGRPIRLHVDHTNGNPVDNRLENLRFLCPNCHSQTSTYCGRNKRGKTQTP